MGLLRHKKTGMFIAATLVLGSLFLFPSVIPQITRRYQKINQRGFIVIPPAVSNLHFSRSIISRPLLGHLFPYLFLQ